MKMSDQERRYRKFRKSLGLLRAADVQTPNQRHGLVGSDEWDEPTQEDCNGQQKHETREPNRLDRLHDERRDGL